MPAHDTKPDPGTGIVAREAWPEIKLDSRALAADNRKCEADAVFKCILVLKHEGISHGVSEKWIRSFERMRSTLG